MSYIVILAILVPNLFLFLAILITIRILSQYQNSKLALAATLVTGYDIESHHEPQRVPKMV